MPTTSLVPSLDAISVIVSKLAPGVLSLIPGAVRSDINVNERITPRR